MNFSHFLSNTKALFDLLQSNAVAAGMIWWVAKDVFPRLDNFGRRMEDQTSATTEIRFVLQQMEFNQRRLIPNPPGVIMVNRGDMAAIHDLVIATGAIRTPTHVYRELAARKDLLIKFGIVSV